MNSIQYVFKRNPLILLLSNEEVFYKIQTIGDPHLGRVFKTGVPSDRRGSRETSVMFSFKTYMNPTDPLVKDVVIMGDLFDKFVVSPTVLLEAYSIIIAAFENNTEVRYTFIPGNHDLSKDITKKSSYEVLCNLLWLYSKGNPRLTALLNNPTSFEILDGNGSLHTTLVFDCYSPFPETKQDLIIPETENTRTIYFGHWDSLDILDSGYTPSKEVLSAASLVVSGHEHVYKRYSYPYDVNKTPVLFTGSLQPYSHAEDPDRVLYITLSQEAFEECDKDTLKFKCVRILCEHSFVLKEPLDCLSLSFLFKEKEELQELKEEDIKIDESYSTRMLEALKEIESPSSYNETLLKRFKDKDY